MKVICAPDKFKESLTAIQAAAAMARGVRRAWPDAEIDLCPICDGGDGFSATMAAALGGTMRSTRVAGPLPGQQVDAAWAMAEDRATGQRTAFIEMAAASGLALVPPPQRDPTRTTTYGTGQLIRHAIEPHACKRILIGIGGSATTDGGCGMAQALGVRFFDQHDRLIEQPIAGGVLSAISRFGSQPASALLAGIQVTVACDVTNPLTGPRGAAAVYGPQKGATPQKVKQLDDGLHHLASLLRAQLGIDVESLPGGGAAGGLGAGLVAFAGAKLRRGIELVLEAVRFDERVAGCDLCLTGEGRLDGQSIEGKACIGVAQAARRRGVPTIALVGAAGPDADRTLDAGLAAYRVIGPGLSAAESMRRAAELLENAAAAL